DLLAAPNASGQRLAVLHHGDSLSVITLPSARSQEYTNVRTGGSATQPGFVRTAELSDWSGATADASFSIAKLFAPEDGAGEAELISQLERWNQFIGRYPGSPQSAEANLEAARIELALGKLGKSAGKPQAEWSAHLTRAREA